MFQSIKNFFYFLIDEIFPLRSNFNIVKKLDKESISLLPKSLPVYGMSWIYPLFHYKDSRVRAIIWELKYRENTLPLEYIGKMIYEEIISIISDILLFNSDAEFLIIPIPMTNSRKRERGYNQSEYITKAIIEHDISHLLLYAPQWFQKIKETPPQSHSQSREERMKNLIDCFQADSRISGKYVILIDDVVTTGSTLLEARQTIFEVGAKDIMAFTIAH